MTHMCTFISVSIFWREIQAKMKDCENPSFKATRNVIVGIRCSWHSLFIAFLIIAPVV